jgi:23S rRNA pseudouridine1911/1915/1917 synthase
MDEVDDDAADEVGQGRIELRPTREQINERLDRFVAASLPDLSRTYVQQLIEAGNIRVDGVVRRSTFKMTPGEVVVVDVPPPRIDRIEPEAIPLAILYEDEDVIVLDKPAGVVVHPAPGHRSGTLVNALLHHAPEIAVGGTNRPGIVHRLDKETSGLMVVAKTDRARTTLVAQWAQRSVEKGYVALVEGSVESDEGTIDVPIGRDPTQRQRMAPLPRGRSAISHFSVKRRFERSTLLDVVIETGRTHQIRVHFAFIGHPVVGDLVYGRPGAERAIGLRRQFLHAARLAFRLPGGRPVAFDSPLPDDLRAVLARLEAGEPSRARPIARDA